ncbi:MAG: hypothetical protein ACRCSQ_02495 [Bacteroidales bacterium]
MKTHSHIAIKLYHHPFLNFRLNGCYELTQNGYPYETEQYAEISDHKILFSGDFYDEIDLIPIELEATCTFAIPDIESQRNASFQLIKKAEFSGRIRLIILDEEILAINIIPIEE